MDRIAIDLTAPDDDAPLLDEEAGDASAMVLPDGAALNRDGTVTLLLAYPVMLAFKMPGGPEVKQSAYDTLIFRRLNGADMRQVLAAKGARGAQVAIARATGLSAARVALLYGRMDASDMSAANAVVAALCGVDGEEGLPQAATVADDGAVTLPFGRVAEPADAEPRDALTFRRLRGEDMIAISQSRDVLQTAIARGAGLSLREANALFDAMDAADITGVQRVVGFLCGSGRKTGG